MELKSLYSRGCTATSNTLDVKFPVVLVSQDGLHFERFVSHSFMTCMNSRWATENDLYYIGEVYDVRQKIHKTRYINKTRGKCAWWDVNIT